MSFASLDQAEIDAPLAEINMVPLIDVMIVLMVIFLVTAPMLTHAVKLELPQASSKPLVEKVANVQLSIDAAGKVYWNSEAVSAEVLKQKLSQNASIVPQPELHLRVDKTTPYEKVAQLLSEASQLGNQKMGFITDPSTP